jgi:hypothetical protein
MVQQGQFILNLGRRIADAATRPQWKPVPAAALPPQRSTPASSASH